MSEAFREQEVLMPSVDPNSFVHHETGMPLLDLLRQQEVFQDLLIARQEGSTKDVIANLEKQAIRQSIDSVRSCLKYKPGVKPWDGGPEGDCYTFSWLMSDVAEQFDMNSLIVFCNGHAFNVIETIDGEVHMINGETKDFWFFDCSSHGCVQDVMPIDSMRALSEDYDKEVHYFPLHTKGLRVYCDSKLAPQYNVALPWVESDLPAAAAMKPALAKEAMYAYDRFQSSLDQGNITDVLANLHFLKGRNPVAETRYAVNEDLKTFKRRIKQWSQDDGIATEDLLSIIHAYEAIMPSTKSMNIFIGDCYREIAGKREDVVLASVSQKYYETAQKKGLQPNRRDGYLEGKIQKAKDLELALAERKACVLDSALSLGQVALV